MACTAEWLTLLLRVWPAQMTISVRNTTAERNSEMKSSWQVLEKMTATIHLHARVLGCFTAHVQLPMQERTI